MRITTLDILNTDIGVEVEVIDYDTDNYLGRINVNLDGKGKLVIEHQVQLTYGFQIILLT